MSRRETYLRLERQLDGNVSLGRERIGTLAAVLVDRLRLPGDDNAPYILSIFRKLFAKIETENITDYAFLLPTTCTIVEICTAAIENGEAASAEGYFEVLSAVPSHVYRLSDDRLLDSVAALIGACLRRFPETLAVSFFNAFVGSLLRDERKRFAERGTNVWLSSMIPCIFDSCGRNRKFGLNISDKIIEDILKTDYFHHSQWKAVSENIRDKTKYPKVVLDMFDSGDPLWCETFIFIIKILGLELHKMGGSINHWLYILQEALKKNVDVKCQALTCLKQLMDNYALDPKILEHPNRVKIFSAVFESNNAKTEKISILKFRIWWYFICLIQDNIKLHYETILIPFLTYCFGDPKKDGTNQSEVNKVCPGLVFPSIKKLSVKMFVELCGHKNCNDCTKNAIIKLKQPLLNCNFLGDNHIKLIYALKKITIFICTREPNIDQAFYEELIQNLKCIWTSFIRVATTVKRSDFLVVIKSILQLLDSFVEIHEGNEKLSEVITTIIIPAVVDTQFGYRMAVLNDKSIKINKLTPLQYLIRLVSKLCHKETDVNSCGKLRVLINIGLYGDLKDFTDWFLNSLLSYNYASVLWYSLEDALLLSSKQIPPDVILSTLLWPINNYKCDEKVILVMDSWDTLFNIKKPKIYSTKELLVSRFEEEVLSSVINATKKDNSNILCIFFLSAFMKKQAEDRLGQVVTFEKSLTGFRDVLNTIESKHLTSVDSVVLCRSLQCLEKLLSICHAYLIDLSSLNNLIYVINRLLKILTKYYKSDRNNVLESSLESSSYFDTFLDSLNCLISTKYSEQVLSAVMELIHNIKENIPYSNIKEKASHIVAGFLLGENNTLEESELMKIQLLMNKHSKSNNFTMSTKKVNSCLEKHIAPDETGIKIVPLKKQKLDEFIVIKPTWKFDPRNLTEHQKDSLKRRRDDIPALYEDLSQSQDDNTMKAWKPPGYHSDSQESSSTIKNVIANSNVENQNNTECERKITERVTQMLNSCNENISEVLISKSNASVDKQSVDSIKKPTGRVAQMINTCLTENLTESKHGFEISNNTVNENTTISKINIMNEDNLNLLNDGDEVAFKGFDTSAKENIENNHIICSDSKKIDTTTNFKGEKNKSILSKLNDSIKNLKNINEDALAFDPDVLSKNNFIKSVQDVGTVKVLLEDNVIGWPLELDRNLDGQQNSSGIDKSMDKNEPDMNKTDFSIDSKSSDSSQSTQETSLEKNFSTRPLRAKRKPSKLLTNISMSNNNNRNSKIKSKTNEKTLKGCEVNGQNTKKSFTNEKNDANFVIEIDALSKTNKKTHRLINQLSIDTIEGHPLLISNKNSKSTKCTRRSLQNVKNSQDGNETVNNMKIQKRKSCFDVKTLPFNDIINDKDDNIKLNKGNSIFSQDTEVLIETEDILCHPADNISLKTADQVAIVSIDRLFKDSQGKFDSFQCSPDFIESSQEDSLSHKTLVLKNNLTSLEQTKDEPLTLKQLNTNLIEKSTTGIEFNDVETNYAQIYDADTEPVTHSVYDADTLPITDVSDEISDKDVTLFKEAQENCSSNVVNYDSSNDCKDNDTTYLSDRGDSSNSQNLLNNTSIASSPCKDDTNERLTEFLNNTMDISPIKSVSSENSYTDNVSPSKTDIPKENMKTPVDKVCTHKTTVISPDLFCSEKTDQCSKTSPSKSMPACESNNWALMKNVPSRTAQMLSLCMTNDPINNAKQNEITEVKLSEFSNEDEKNNTPLLEFSKTVPSITASPVGPILKRKLEPDELATSPSSKKKRVSFHDPPVSISVNVEKYIVPKSPLVKITCKADQNINKLPRQSSAKCLMAKLEVHGEPSHLNSIQTIDNKENRVSFATDSQLSDICSLSVDSPQPISIVKNHLLDDVNPIYPNLINCHNSLAEISACLSSPLWNNEFLEEVRDRIVTIGDLAKMSELEVNRLPVKVPKIETVKKVLTEYENNFNKHGKEKESTEYNTIEKYNTLEISNANLSIKESALSNKPMNETGLLVVESIQNSKTIEQVNKTLEDTLPIDNLSIVNTDNDNFSSRLSCVDQSANNLNKAVENCFTLSEECLVGFKVGNIPLDDFLCNCVESGDVKSIIPKTFEKIMSKLYSQIKNSIESHLIDQQEKILNDVTKSLDILKDPKC